jgi:hypothetical protein
MPAVSAGTPTVTTTASLAAVVSVYPVSDYVGDYFATDYIPGTFEAQITTGRPDINGNNVFTITSGSFSFNLNIPIDTSGASSCPFGSAVAPAPSGTKAMGTNRHRLVSKLAGKKLGQNKKAPIDVQ